jgi:hypothetical protein
MKLDVRMSNLNLRIDGHSLAAGNRPLTLRIRPRTQVRIAVARGSCHHVDMAPTSDQTSARHRQRLAALVAQRRAQLRLTLEDAAKVCDIAYMTYRKVEGGQPVRPSTYAKLEVGFGMRAGSCKAVLEGTADSVVLEDGTELIEGGQIARFDADALTEGLPDAVARSAMLVAPELTGRQIHELNEQLMEELRRRGLVP